MKRFMLIPAILATLIACQSGAVEPTGRAEAYLRQHRDIDPDVASALRHGHVIPGMSVAEVEAVLGKPVLVRRSRDGSHEVRTFRGTYFHQQTLRAHNATLVRVAFENGRLLFVEGL